ncbi:hypothetical protein GCM10008014_23020 [Paenibacillus silvae]|uniref:Nudix hydrolase domain-containing protein n=1 Tax=Paenibacillus silvae TaxID=1325358 RepID=A0ABQ1ZBG3_9BACL|nr:hypothetical protein GCM10008014_23020 [Paenibacillus silvae]
MKVNKHTHLGVYGLAKWQQSYLLIQKARGPYVGKWDLPGGRMEFGEQPEASLIREFEEETGLVPSKVSVSSSQSTVLQWEIQGEPEEVHHIGILYHVISLQGNQLQQIKRVADGHDSLGAEWFTSDQIKDMELTPFAKYMIDLCSS